MKTYSGIPVSSGIGIGNVQIVENEEIVVPDYKVAVSEKQENWEKFEQSCSKSINYLSEQMTKADKEQSDIFQTHLMMLSDPEFIKEVKAAFDEDEYCIEFILNKKVKEFAERLKTSGNDYLVERADDIIDAYDWVFRDMQGIPFDKLDSVLEGSVVAALSLKPSDALALSKKKIAAIVTHEGGSTSHLAILARAYGIPYVSGIEGINTLFNDNSLLIVDGNSGSIICGPDEETVTVYKKKLQEEREEKEKLLLLSEKQAETKDGCRIQLLANISDPSEAEYALKSGADGIGLFRTEFFFMNKKKLSEQEQYQAYSKVLDDMKGKPVVIRTLDAGGDKVLTGEGFDAMEAESGIEKNPLLGWRAVRYCLDITDIFKDQLKALFRAGVKRNLSIMIPMISGSEELEKVFSVIDEVKRELTASSCEYAADTPVGIMVETPAAAITAEDLAGQSRFFSIGTNDLTQYTICVDRENAKVSALYNEFHPAVIALIKKTVEAAEKAGIPVSVCGELAGKLQGAFLLYGLGVRKLSASVSVLNKLKEMFSLFTDKELKEITARAVELKNAGKTEEYILKTIKERL
ncbi:MAG: phosphoenolpyruvate--protein phosphotransferase [Treponemataceae bacterium]|nr:phosphoenolpyruvate--protein phosphotransferase [Treponemataceae bacterium]